MRSDRSIICGLATGVAGVDVVVVTELVRVERVIAKRLVSAATIAIAIAIRAAMVPSMTARPR